MRTTGESNADWIVEALKSGQMAERLEAQRLLDERRGDIDREKVRRELVEALKGAFAPNLGDAEHDPAGARCWLLSSLGRVDGDDDTRELLQRHARRSSEPNPWARYWALEALLRRAKAQSANGGPWPKWLLETCKQVKVDDAEDRLPKTLATAILAREGGTADREELKLLITPPNDAEQREARIWSALRALRLVYLPFAVEPMRALLERRDKRNRLLYDDLTYDAIVSLGNVARGTSESIAAALALQQLIERQRDYQFWEVFRIRAIESLGRLGQKSAVPLLVEELADYNPAVAREAALALEAIVGPRTAAQRVLESLAERGDRYRPRLARGLREMRDGESVVAELESLMLTSDTLNQQRAQLLLSEMGGMAAFEKLRNRAKSTEHHLALLERADQRLQERFDETIRDARRGFHIVIGMDVVIFAIGVALIVAALALALSGDAPLDSLSTILTGSSGVLAMAYGRFVAKPREQVERSTQYLNALKAVFLGYLRQLHQVDQAYTLRVMENKPLTADETHAFNELIEQTMDRAVQKVSHGVALGR